MERSSVVRVLRVVGTKIEHCTSLDVYEFLCACVLMPDIMLHGYSEKPKWFFKDYKEVAVEKWKYMIQIEPFSQAHVLGCLSSEIKMFCNL